MIVKLVNWFVSQLANIINAVLLLLPNSPFRIEYDLPEWARFIGVFIPFQSMAFIMVTYVAAVLVYYALRIVLRWTKAVGS